VKHSAPRVFMRKLRPIVAVMTVALNATVMTAAAAPPVPRTDDGEASIVWRDEFDGTTLDRSRWSYELGNGFGVVGTNNYVAGWGNNELQSYTDRPENVSVRDGRLHLRAARESFGGFNYTSGRIVTKGKFAKTYGRFEVRARLPVGKGFWPAFWLLPAAETYGGWAASGEIDVMEAVGSNPNEVLGTLHFGSRWPKNTQSSYKHTLRDGGRISDDHVYALDWQPGVVQWSVDGKPYASERKWWSSSRADGQGRGLGPASDADKNPYPAPFDKPFSLILNLAVGGNLPGNPDASTVFPQEMVVDYVRVYDRPGGPKTPAPSP